MINFLRNILWKQICRKSDIQAPIKYYSNIPIQERLEIRFIFPETYVSQVHQQLKDALCNLQIFNDSYCETIYFANNNLLPLLRYHIRIRRYVHTQKEIINLNTNNSAFIEIKTRTLKNRKIRIEMPSKEATDALAGFAPNYNLYPKKQLPIVFPKVAIRSLRAHYLLYNIRITVDDNIQVFKFRKDNLYMGYQIGDLRFGKIEFKFGIADKKAVMKFAASVLANIEYHKPVFFFMERQLWKVYQHV